MRSGAEATRRVPFAGFGAAIASAILSIFVIVLGGWIGYLILGFIGACLLIWIVRMVRGRTA